MYYQLDTEAIIGHTWLHCITTSSLSSHCRKPFFCTNGLNDKGKLITLTSNAHFSLLVLCIGPRDWLALCFGKKSFLGLESIPTQNQFVSLHVTAEIRHLCCVIVCGFRVKRGCCRFPCSDSTECPPTSHISPPTLLEQRNTQSYYCRWQETRRNTPANWADSRSASDSPLPFCCLPDALSSLLLSAFLLH